MMIRCRISICFAILAVHLLPTSLEAQTQGPSMMAKIETGPDGRWSDTLKAKTTSIYVFK